ncbi:MAG: DUF885 domain-containing protein [Verrucomicrobia bacterium]|nr:DUF885 domain-containing protein [Verrucomicrobiota bacterium]
MFSLPKICCLLLTTFLAAALPSSRADEPTTADARFEKIARDCIEQYLALKPEWATTLGEHRFDARLNDRTHAGIDAEVALAERALQALAAVPTAELSAVNRVDAEILKNNLESTVFELRTVREWQWNPLQYNVGNAIYLLLSREFAPLPERLRNVKGRLEAVPAAVAAAKANLQNPPVVHTETAIVQNAGTLRLVREELNAFLEKAPELKTAIAPVQAAAVAALEDYGKWLKEDLLPRSKGDFRLGDEKFRQRLRYSLESDLSKEEILRRAEAELKKAQAEMYATARPLYRKYFPDRDDPGATPYPESLKAVCKAVLDKLAETRPDNDTIVGLAKTDLKATTDFVRAHRLVSVPDEPVEVVVMPEFQRGFAVAYCDAPGALAKNEATFYAISPTPADWPPARRTSFFKEYNDYMLQDLTIHEAMPGHYLQLTLANRFQAPTLVRGVWTSGMFMEGWATYAEQFMAAAGYGGPEVKMEQLKMRLRLILNAILDQKIHTAGMTEKEAIDLMMNEGFQEEGEAFGKWRRANLSATQLSTYFVGNAEVNDLVRDYRAKHGGDQADVQAMHDRILSFGSAAPRYLRALLGM